MTANASLPKWKRELPMVFTYSRILAAPVIMAVIYIPWTWSGWLAAWLFFFASLTDWADGHFARLYNAQSTAGKLMDPIADKVLVLGPVIMLLAMGRVDPAMVFLLLARDTFIGGVRSIAAVNQIVISAKPFGKWKTGLQMFGVPCLLIYDPLFGVIPIAKIGYMSLWVSVAFSLVSGVQYSYGYFKGSASNAAR